MSAGSFQLLASVVSRLAHSSGRSRCCVFLFTSGSPHGAACGPACVSKGNSHERTSMSVHITEVTNGWALPQQLRLLQVQQGMLMWGSRVHCTGRIPLSSPPHPLPPASAEGAAVPGSKFLFVRTAAFDCQLQVAGLCLMKAV